MYLGKGEPATSQNLDESGTAMEDEEEENKLDNVPPILKYIAKMKAFNANTNFFMKNLPPESTPSMIIVPMNKHGDGYLCSAYDGRFLRGKMSKAEFHHITTEISRITAHAYSENRVVDLGKVPRKLVWMLVFSYIISVVVLILTFIAVDVT